MTPLRILFIKRQQSAVGYYRTDVPAKALAQLGHQVTVDSLGSDPEAKARELIGTFDLLIADRAISEQTCGILAGLRHWTPGARMIVDFDDDFTNVPTWNAAHSNYRPGMSYRTVGLQHLRVAELTTVSTRPLAATFAPKTHAIMACENAIDPKDWQNLPVSPDRGADPCLRILYGGAQGHYGDLDAIRPGLQAFLEKPPVPVRLVCFGALPFWLHELARQIPGRVVSLPWVPFPDYPSTIAWGGVNLAIAPLAAHGFNTAKSNIKWLEAAIQGIPFLCSNVGPYAEIPEGCAVRAEDGDWQDALNALVTDPDFRATIASRALSAVLDSWTLDQKRDSWQTAVETVMSRPRIESYDDTVLASGDTGI